MENSLREFPTLPTGPTTTRFFVFGEPDAQLSIAARFDRHGSMTDDAPYMRADEPIALKEVQLRLGVPQHILIHLCEKGVIEPDFADTRGRGKRREFSHRNLFEFALALALRRFELPVATTALIVRVLRSFARAIAKDVPGFVLPNALADGKIDLALHLYDGEHLVLSAVGASFRKPLLLSTRVGSVGRSSETTPRVARLDELPEKYEACLEIDLSEIARNALTE